MRMLNLDYSPNQVLAQRMLIVSVLFCTLLTIANFVYYRKISFQQAQQEMVKSKIDRLLAQKRQSANRFTNDPQKATEFLAFSNQVMEKLNLPWDQLFQVLEQTKSDQIALLAVEPEIKDGVINVKISGEAKGLSSLFAYVKALNASGSLTKAYLVEHNMDEQNPDHPIHFVLEALWIKRP